MIDGLILKMEPDKVFLFPGCSLRARDSRRVRARAVKILNTPTNARERRNMNTYERTTRTKRTNDTDVHANAPGNPCQDPLILQTLYIAEHITGYHNVRSLCLEHRRKCSHTSHQHIHRISRYITLIEEPYG